MIYHWKVNYENVDAVSIIETCTGLSKYDMLCMTPLHLRNNFRLGNELCTYSERCFSKWNKDSNSGKNKHSKLYRILGRASSPLSYVFIWY